MLNELSLGFFTIFSHVENLISLITGVILGVIVGAIPGMSSVMVIALMAPFTYYFPPVLAIGFLLGVYKGAVYGGSIPAVLIRTPGTPASVVSVFEGYPLTQQGKAVKALRAVVRSSFIGDFFSDIVLIVVAAPLASVALKFGPIETFALLVFSLTIIVTVSGRSFLKGLFSAGLGLLFSCVGMDPSVGTARLTFGSMSLMSGFALIPVLIGLFGVSEVLRQAESRGVELDSTSYVTTKSMVKSLPLRELFRHWKVILRSSMIGTTLGALPGIGSSVAAFLSYAEAKRASKHPEEYGRGSIEGLIACETGNSAVVGASLIPMVTFGIPGDAAAAVLIGAFVVAGLRPGPLLISEHTHVIYTLFAALLFCNFVYLAIGELCIPLFNLILYVRRSMLFPIVIMFCFLGTYGFNMSLFDVYSMFGFGLLGYFMEKYDFALAPLVIAFILGPMVETALVQALIITDQNIFRFFTKPIALGFFIITLVLGIFIARRKRRMEQF